MSHDQECYKHPCKLKQKDCQNTFFGNRDRNAKEEETMCGNNQDLQIWQNSLAQCHQHLASHWPGHAPLS